MTTTDPLIHIIPLSTGGYQIACDGCDSLTAEWDRTVAQYLADHHQCPGRWERGEGR